MLSPHFKNYKLTTSLLSLILLSGCQVVSVKQQTLDVTISNERDSILTRNKLSEASLNVLSMTGQDAKTCDINLESCLNNIQKTVQIPQERFYATGSELYLAKAKSLESTSACKHKENEIKSEKQETQQHSQHQCLDAEIAMLDKSIRYSFAYLFRSNRPPQQRIFDNRQVQIRDFYNQAIAKLVSAYTLRHPERNPTGKVLRIGNSDYFLDFEHYPELAKATIENHMSSYNLNFSGLRSINRRDGFGSEFVTILHKEKNDEENKYILDPLHHKFKNGISPNIHPPRYLPTTLTIEPDFNTSTEDLLKDAPMRVKVYDPYKYESIHVGQQTYPLAANFSAPYGLWLAQNNLAKSAYLSLIDRDQNLTMPHLFMLEPYDPNKKIIVLVHGLASSPEAWIRLTNDVMGDSVLRKNYQVWQVFYSTNMPIMESRFQIYALLQQSFALVDPNVPAAKDAVLIGHSMGGIIARLLVSNADINQQAFKLVNSQKLLSHRNDTAVVERLKIHPIPNFDRAIFISAPHQGTAFADLWFTKVARRIIKLPGAFIGTVSDTLQGDINLKDALKQINHGLIQNGPSDLSYHSRFMELTKDIAPPSNFIFHSIMGNNTKSNDPNIMTDGIVPYESSHLTGAASEKIIHGGHSIQETPEAVLELRRILRLHLIQHGLSDQDSQIE